MKRSVCLNRSSSHDQEEKAGGKIAIDTSAWSLMIVQRIQLLLLQKGNFTITLLKISETFGNETNSDSIIAHLQCHNNFF